jgi:hypothetical protein
MRIAVVISSMQKEYLFHFFASKSFKLEDQNIEESFYLKWYGSVHQGVHFEMEIYSQEILKHPLMDKKPSPLHVHLSEKNGKQYVCWTGPVPTFQYALEMLKAWCVGTVYTMENGKDYATLFNGRPDLKSDDFKGLCYFLDNYYNIEIESTEHGD